MYQLRAVPVSEHCIKTIRRACQNLYLRAVGDCNPSEIVTRASICCKYSSGVQLWSKPSKGLLGSAIEVAELMYVGVFKVDRGIVVGGIV